MIRDEKNEHCDDKAESEKPRCTIDDPAGDLGGGSFNLTGIRAIPFTRSDTRHKTIHGSGFPT